ncbi:hypothetical protein LI82_12335 [Methanococcoides methylutens]|uniref:Uncharacterized protein n=1 Tax=Methanococcoides methylutens TaxID=2226 RepID=A0A099T007_METMT|nr:hypothetical protein [Methanococcoides methylutens]KGK98477.1 hypothetical protein LI82_12335 [Methanococcoides methylutens]
MTTEEYVDSILRSRTETMTFEEFEDWLFKDFECQISTCSNKVLDTYVHLVDQLRLIEEYKLYGKEDINKLQERLNILRNRFDDECVCFKFGKKERKQAYIESLKKK